MEGGKYVIVHVDDNLIAREMVKEAMTEAGFIIFSAVDAQDLEQRLMVRPELRASVDLFILDMEMPDMTGAQVGGVLPFYDELGGVPFVIYSGKEKEWVDEMSAEVASVSEGFRNNYKGYIGKGLGALEKLVALVRSIVERKQ